jgi:hypothetical protein
MNPRQALTEGPAGFFTSRGISWTVPAFRFRGGPWLAAGGEIGEGGIRDPWTGPGAETSFTRLYFDDILYLAFQDGTYFFDDLKGNVVSFSHIGEGGGCKTGLSSKLGSCHFFIDEQFPQPRIVYTHIPKISAFF